MPPTFRYLRSSFAVLGLATAAPLAVAQAPKPPAGVEVLARGAVHEAFATTNEFPEAGPVVPKQPPAPVEELPPDEKPAGDNVQWVPGYWNWDEDRKDFIWISGFWRVPPPGRVWVPGSWREVPGGSQWVPGFWQAPAPRVAPGQPAAQTDLDYLPPPPQPLEQNPSVPAPGDDSIYVPGSWVYRERYVWRPGYWIDYRPNWIWVPAHYRWTPVGYVFVDGYWDYPLANRGVLYAPVAFAPTVIAQPTFVYTPTYCVPAPTLYTAMFVRQRHCGYFFGDYFEAQYGRGGYRPWCGTTGASGFALSVGFGRGGFYDANWFQFSVGYRSQPAVLSTFGDVYGGRFRGDLPRPPRTFVQQNTVVNNTTVVNNNITNITNVTNNTTNVTRSVAASPLVATHATLQRATPSVNFQPVAQADRVREQQFARETQNLAAQRQKQEIALAARNPNPARPQPLGSPNAVGRPEVQPQRVKLDVPDRVAARAQMPTAPDKAPPPAPKPQSDRRGPEANPRQNPGNVQPRPGDVQPTAPKPTPTPAPNTNPAPQPRPGDVKPTPTPAPNTNPANPTPRPRPGDVQPTPPKPMPTPRPDDVQPTAPKPTPTPAPNTNPAPQPRPGDPAPAPRPRPGDVQPTAPKPTPTPAPNTNPTPQPRPGNVQSTAPKPTPTPAPNTNPAPQPRPGNVQPPAPKPTPAPVPTPPPAPKPPPVPTPPAPRVPTPPPAPKPPPVPQAPAPKPQPVPTPPVPPRPQPAPQPPQQRNVPPAPKPQPKPQPAPAPTPMVRAQSPAQAPIVRAQAPQAPRPQPVAAPVVRPAPRPAAPPPAARAPVPARPQPPAARPAPAPIPAGKVPPKQNRPQR